MKCYLCSKEAKYWISDKRGVCKLHFKAYEKWINSGNKTKSPKTETLKKGEVDG